MLTEEGRGSHTFMRGPPSHPPIQEHLQLHFLFIVLVVQQPERGPRHLQLLPRRHPSQQVEAPDEPVVVWHGAYQVQVVEGVEAERSVHG